MPKPTKKDLQEAVAIYESALIDILNSGLLGLHDGYSLNRAAGAMIEGQNLTQTPITDAQRNPKLDEFSEPYAKLQNVRCVGGMLYMVNLGLEAGCVDDAISRLTEARKVIKENT